MRLLKELKLGKDVPLLGSIISEIFSNDNSELNAEFLEDIYII